MTPDWSTGEHFTPPEPGHVDVWHLEVPPAGPVLSALEAVLSEPERQRAGDKRIPDRRREYVTGQASLRLALAAALGTSVHDIRYRRGRKGKPYVSEAQAASGVYFNITHSGGHVMLALTLETEIGVDLEWMNDRTSCARVARRAFTERERETSPDFSTAQGRRHFFRLWTAKEAVVKCSGDGIHSGMARFSVDLDGDTARVSEAHENQRKVAEFSVVPLPAGNRFAATVVYADAATRRLNLTRVHAHALLRNSA